MKIFPSILSADFSCLKTQIREVEKAGVEQLHLDVMDGHFVPNISFGFPVIESLVSAFPKMKWDVHLMIEDPERYMDTLLDIGIDWISFHLEVDPPVESIAKTIRSEGTIPGLAVNPDTSPTAIEPYLDVVDYVVLMTVQPGFGGQSFREPVLDKIGGIREHFDGPIQVDGGIGEETIQTASKAGVEWFVAGSAVFGQESAGKAVKELAGRIDRL